MKDDTQKTGVGSNCIEFIAPFGISSASITLAATGTVVGIHLRVIDILLLLSDIERPVNGYLASEGKCGHLLRNVL